jgi:hypothetical protein
MNRDGSGDIEANSKWREMCGMKSLEVPRVSKYVE